MGLYGSDQSVVKKINTQDRKTAKIYPKAANITEPRMVPRSRHLGVFNTILFSKAYYPSGFLDLQAPKGLHALILVVFYSEFLDIPL